MSVNYREPQWLLPNEKNLQYPAAGATQGSGLTADRHSLYSMDFDGSSYISAGNPTELQFTDSFSISGWFKSSSSSSSAIVSKDANLSGRCYLVQLNSLSPGTLRFRIFVSNVSVTIDHGTGLNDNNWHHFVCVYEKGVGISLYVDNGTPGFTATTGTIDNDAVDFNIGRRGDGLNYFDGKIDEVAIFSRALSSSEITTLYNSGSPSNPMLLSGKPVAYYPLGEQARKPGTAEWRFPNEVLQGQAIDFDGNDDIFTTPSNLFSGANKFTISLWANLDANSTANVAYSLYNDSSNRMFLQFYNGQLYIRINSGSSAGTYTIASGVGNWSSSTVLNQWGNVTIVYDGTQGVSNDRLKVWVNGDANTSGSYSGTFPTSLATWTDDFYIGAEDGASSQANFLNGKLSNLAIWDTDQSANIANIYNYGAPQTSYTVTPTAWYKLDKTSEYAGLNPNWHNALSFNGSSDYVDLGSVDETEGITTMSISGWFKPASSGVAGASGIIAKESRDFYVGWYSVPTNSIRFLISDDDGVTNDSLNSLTLGSNANVLNKWHHFVCTWDASDKLKIYINGSLSTETNSVNATSALPASTNAVEIGRRITNYFNGQISNLAIYNQIISAEDVKYLYNGGTPQTNISFEPVSWWKLNNLTTGIQDSGSASNNGTNNGATAVSSSVAVDQWNFDNAVQLQTPNWSSALEFKPIDSDYIRIPDNDSLSFGNGTADQPFSLSIWANLNDVTNANLFAKNGSNNREYQFNFASNNKLYLLLYSQLGGSYIGRRVDTDLSSYENQWIHLVATYDGNSTVSGIKIYINGSQKDNATSSSGTYVAMDNGPRDLFLGRFSSDYINGELSNAQIYNVELSSSQVETLYNNGQPESTASLSPMSWWKLDNTTTGIQDSGSASNNGALENTPTEIQTNVWTPRLNGESDTLPSTALVSSDLQFNSAYSSFSLDFDAGSGDYIDCGTTLNSMLELGDSFSVSAWINFGNTATERTIVSNMTTSVRGFQFRVLSNEGIRIIFAENGSTFLFLDSSSLNINTWHHAVFTYDGSNTIGGLNLYINGSLDNNTTGTQGTLTTITSTDSLKIGAYTSAHFFDGKIDEVSVFNKVLNQAEITSIYNNGYPKDITALSPISWWRLGEDAYFNGNDFIIPNQITGAPNGTSNGMPATALVADAPGSYAAGLGSSLALADRVGDAPLSTANSLSFNMTPENRVSYPAGYTPTQVDNVYSMDFDGANDYIDCGDSNAFSFGNSTADSAFSISAWVKFTSSGTVGIVSKYGTTNSLREWLLYRTSSKIRLLLHNGSTNSYATGSTSLSQDVWYHITATYDGRGGSTAYNGINIYINGQAETLTYAGGSYTAMQNTSQPVEIGRYQATRYIEGSIDEVAIFDYALTPRQIKQDIYNGTTSGKTADLNNISNLTPPVAWYRMGD